MAIASTLDLAERDPKIQARKRKVIVACAITGSVHTPSMSEYLPITAAQITEQAIEAARAGAAILHLHARNADGSPTLDPAAFEAFVPAIAAQTDAIISIATSDSTPRSLEERLAYPSKARPELCSLDMGSMNFAFHKAARGVVNWKWAWEKSHVEGSDDFVLRNSVRDLGVILGRLDGSQGVRFEYVCHDVGHLYTLAHFVEEGLVKPPLFIQFSLGVLGGLNGDPEDLFLMRATADRLFGRQNYEFSALGTGRRQMPLAAMAATMGGHVRVGLEHSLLLGRGLLATSCSAQVLKIRRILEELSLDVASPEEARDVLQTRRAKASQRHD
jgi:uncharacterized protein (DUF849 family)